MPAIWGCLCLTMKILCMRMAMSLLMRSWRLWLRRISLISSIIVCKASQHRQRPIIHTMQDPPVSCIGRRPSLGLCQTVIISGMRFAMGGPHQVGIGQRDDSECTPLRTRGQVLDPKARRPLKQAEYCSVIQECRAKAMMSLWNTESLPSLHSSFTWLGE